jgi:dnd system-associated protein 4
VARDEGTTRDADGGPRAVRRSSDKEELLRRLTDGTSPFPTYRDALVFAAALGWNQRRRVPLKNAGGEPIRWATMTNRLGTEDVVDMVAAAHSGDPQILTAPRVNERISIFEEYANGGLEYLEATLASQGATPMLEVINDLVRAAMLPPEQSDAPDLDAFVHGLDLG